MQKPTLHDYLTSIVYVVIFYIHKTPTKYFSTAPEAYIQKN